MRFLLPISWCWCGYGGGYCLNCCRMSNLGLLDIIRKKGLFSSILPSEYLNASDGVIGWRVRMAIRWISDIGPNEK